MLGSASFTRSSTDGIFGADAVPQGPSFMPIPSRIDRLDWLEPELRDESAAGDRGPAMLSGFYAG